jgi:hypothetical protein
MQLQRSLGAKRANHPMVARMMIVVGLVALVGPCAVQSAELFYMDHDQVSGRQMGAVGPLVISGDIESGDYQRLLQKIGSDPNRFTSQNKLIVASNSGDVAEALQIAQLIQAMFTRVTVSPQTGPCAGACFLIYVAAAQRSTDADHLLGLQRPAITEPAGSSVDFATATEGHVRDFLVSNDVPTELISVMLDAHAEHVHWLSVEEERALGNESAPFRRYVKTHCAKADSAAHARNAGSEAALRLSACRDGLSPPQARSVLARILKPAGSAGARSP